MNKKRIFGIVIFIALGFFMFTFANPNDRVEEENDNKSTIENTKKETNETKEQATDETNVETENAVLPIANNNLAFVPANLPVLQQVVNENNQVNTTTEANIEESKNEEVNEEENKNEVVNEEENKNEEVNEEENKNEEVNEEENKNEETNKEQEALTRYATLIKEALRQYAQDKDFKEESLEAVETILNRAYNFIDNAKTNVEIDSIATLAKRELDELKDNEILNAYKKEAIDEVENHIEDLDEYRSEQQQEISNIINEAKEKINNAKDSEEVDSIKDEVLNKLDEVKTNDELYLEETRLVKFLDRKGNVISSERIMIGSAASAPTVEANYTENYVTFEFSNWDTDFSNIENDIEVKPVYIVSSVLARVFELKEEVTRPARTSAAKKSDYTFIKTVSLDATNTEILNAIKKNRIVTLDNEVNSYLVDQTEIASTMDDNFKSYEYYVIKHEMDGFHIDRQLTVNLVALNNYRTSSKNEISSYVNSSDYRETEQASLGTIIRESNSSIDTAVSKTAIDTIVTNAKASIDSLKTNAEYVQEAKAAAIKEISDYVASADLTYEDYITEANGVLSKYTGIINKDNNDANYAGYVASAKSEIDAIKNKVNNNFYTATAIDPDWYDWDYKYLKITNIASDVKIKKVTFKYEKGQTVVFDNGNMTRDTMIDHRLQDAVQVEIEFVKAGGRFVDLYNVVRVDHLFGLYETIEKLQFVSRTHK